MRSEESIPLSVVEVSRTPLEFEAGTALHVHRGRPLVADRFGAQLVLVEPGRGEIERWGTRGEGPGEFQSITDVIGAPNDGIWILDVGRYVGIRLSDKGEFVEEVALPGLPLVAHAAPSGGIKGVWVLGFDLFLSGVGATDGAPAPRLEIPPALPTLLKDLPSGAAPLTGGAWTGEGTIVLAAPWRYELMEIREDLTLVRSIVRDVPAQLPTQEDLEVLRESITTALKTTSAAIPESTIDLLVKQRADEPKPPLVVGVIDIDPGGRVWALTTRRDGRGAAVDVFSSEGSFLGSVSVPGRPHALAFDSDRLFVLTRETSGMDIIVEYRVNVPRA